MNQLDALKTMCHYFPGGRPAIALRMGKNDEVLRKELAGDPKFKLGVIDAERIAVLCIEAKSEHCYAYANAVAASCGGFVRLDAPALEAGGSVNLQRSMSEVIQEMSDVATTTIDGDADAVISDNDLARSLKEIADARSALQIHERNLRRKNAAGKPVPAQEWGGA